MPEKRNLPSWMDKDESSAKKPINDRESKGRNETVKQSANFSNLLEGVVFVLSGFVNPERGILRSQAMEMGAEYQPDWKPGSSTLLICAFPNTPKFRQVQADCGTIVSKEWISECYSHKKLVDIETYVMHAGKPWRRSNASQEMSEESNKSPPRRPQRQNEGSNSKQTTSAGPKNKANTPAKACFSPSTVKKWAIDDLKNTLSWLESQEEKPEPSEIKKIAAGGILTCLQDAIDCLEKKQDISRITEQWNLVPRVVEELAKLDKMGENGSPMSKQDLYEQAKECKRVYEMEFDSVEEDDSSLEKSKKPKSNTVKKRDSKGSRASSGREFEYDSDDTIEMTEEEIDLAYNNVSSKLHNH